MANLLINQSSPYLLQHASNPVDWYPWGMEALQRAKKENKLIIVSIGYSACHWCHVMEHESFEDTSVANIMNENFICIKVDREERPDIDQIYMLAVQLMTGRGGWPLNCICLPDQRPIYGGTYFHRDDWKNILLNLVSFWKEKPEEACEYADRLVAGIAETEKLNLSDNKPEYSQIDLHNIVEPWLKMLDLTDGGMDRAPKFPMPNNWQFILRYVHFFKNNTAEAAFNITLKKMAYGGIYDHLGGGFSRYSVDKNWHIPHFEKMLYDNAQLVSLYSEAYQYSKEEFYRKVVFETINWLKREMTSPEGGFYSALDADSEGVEGKFYTFSKSELQEVIGEDSRIFFACFNITDEGNWAEEHTNVLMRTQGLNFLAEELGLPAEEVAAFIDRAKKSVFEYRQKRIRPGLDNKILASWNGLMLKGLTDAYKVFKESDFLETALRNAKFILDNFFTSSGSLVRNFNRSKSGTAFLDDYAFIIDAFIGLYEVTFDESWLQHARRLNDYVLENFFDPGTGLFYYTSKIDEELIVRKHEVLDNVIPSSNSVMALNLYKLGHFFYDESYIEQSDQMLRTVFPLIKTYGPGYSNWGILLMYEIVGLSEIVITGNESEKKRKELEEYFIPNKITLGGVSGTLPLLEGKPGFENKIYVCENRTCYPPVKEAKEAIEHLLNRKVHVS